MNTIDKAEQLVRIYYINATDFMDSNREAREASITFALVCVEEILGESKLLEEIHGQYYSSRIKYWNEVKQELLKL